MAIRKIWNKVLVGFVNGIVVLLPTALTIVLVKFLVLQVNNAVLNPIMKIFGPMDMAGKEVYLAKGIILIAVILVVSLIGWMTKVLIVTRAFSWGEKLLIKLPILGKVYNAIKQISSAFLGQGKTIFKQVVLIEYPRKGIYSVGFTTGTSKGEIKECMGQNGINVFVPTTPNPTSGMFLIVPRDNIQFLKMSVEEGMKFVISGGSVMPSAEAPEVNN